MKRLTRSKRAMSAVALSLVLGVGAFAAVAFADNVVNDIDSLGDHTITAGGQTTIGYKVNGVGNDGCDAADGSSVTLNLSIPANVSAKDASNQPVSSLTFSDCQAFQYITFSSNVAGDYPITGTVTDSGGTSGYRVQSDFTLHVGAATPSDTTAPNISYVLAPPDPDGNNGWYKSNVSLTWTVTELESAGSLVKTGCNDQNITADQTSQTYSCSATSTGGSAGPVSVSIKRDGTAPVIQRDTSQDSCSVPGNNGWCRGTQTAGFTASDATSGLANSGDAAFTKSSSTNGSAVNIASGAVSDNAGNTASSINAGPFQIDSTAPTTSVTGVIPGKQYVLGVDVLPTPGCSVSDATSGPVNQNPAPTTTGGPLGSISISCSGQDNAGNTSSAGAAYSVIYDWTGFFRPVDNPSVLNVVKGGSSVPMKFSLNGDQGLNILAAGYPKSIKVDCDTVNEGPSDVLESTTTANTGLKYDAAADQYNYVWKTEKAWSGTCRQFRMELIDGETHVANFKITK